MMKRTNIYAAFMAMLMLVAAASCRKKETVDTASIPFLGGDTTAGNAVIDKWIYDTYTQPYNVEVKYKFDQFEATDMTATIIPIKENIVVPALSNIKSVWIDTYEAEAGTTFMKTYVVKLINLIGSPSYNANGSILLGEAEGGVKINLYDMNRYDPLNDRPLFVQKMHTIHHEFGHILHQNKPYPSTFQEISAGLYTGNWTQTTDQDAWLLGFVTAYARSGPDEDFVETIATMLVEGKSYFDQLKYILTVNGYTAAASALSQKEQMVVAYYKDKWNIDFYSLQARVKAAMDLISAPPPPVPLSSVLGYGTGGFNQLYLGSADMGTANLHGSFGDALSSALSTFNADYGPYGLSMDSLYFRFQSSDTLLVHFIMTDGANLYDADYRYQMTTASTGAMTFGPVIVYPNRGTAGGNASALQSSLTTFLSFITANTLIAQWPGGAPDFSQIPLLGGLYVQSDTTSNIIGKLGNY